MRTNIEIDDELMKKALALQRPAHEEGGRRGGPEAARSACAASEDLLELAGKVKWEGDLDQMRRNRFATGRDAASGR